MYMKQHQHCFMHYDKKKKQYTQMYTYKHVRGQRKMISENEEIESFAI